MNTLLRSIGVVSLGIITLAAYAQELQGADAALRKAAQGRTKGSKEGGNASALKQAVDDYLAASKSMWPAAAAAGWLTLYDRYAALGQEAPIPMSTLVAALPSPASWDAIATGLRKRTAGKKGMGAASVDLLAELLRGNVPAQWQAMATLLKSGANPSPFGGNQVAELYRELARHNGDRKRLASSVTMALNAKNPDAMMPVQVPDLVTLVGAAEAGKILTAALTSGKSLVVSEGKATRALAQKLALANVKQLKVPQWNLIDVRTTRLYEAMAARFANKAIKGQRAEEVARARTLYMFGLLLEGRRAEALKIARTVSNAGYYFAQRGSGGAFEALVGTRDFTAFLGEAVAGRPDSPFWDLYLVSAARSGESPKVVAQLQRELAAPKLTQSARLGLGQRLWGALLAADRVDEALALMKRQLSRPGEPSMVQSVALTYARIGHLLRRPAVVEEGIAAAKKTSLSSQEHAYYGNGDGLVELLLDLGRNAEAERLAIDSYVKVSSGEEARYVYGNQPNSALVSLAKLYYRLDRPADVRTLLDRAPDWGVKDAADLANTAGFYDSDETPIGFVAAWALAKTGSKGPAETVLNRVLAKHGSFDPAFALLRELRGTDTISRLDAIYAADQFEERPLIWKAVALKELGRLEEAEATIRKAISVDPSDGETKGGHRMYAYSVLADILAARGDETGAKEYRSAVAAIRVAEEADELAQVGLLTRAIDQYLESTRLFSAAYCIQSRLAVDLMQQGRVKEAEEHYRRAYELMPSSFGRVETHCMGCEHVFEGQIAQNIAERVFTQLAVKTPEKPQVHYLLGYLRFEQGRTEEAMALYRKAVTLDPDYLNAWKQMAGLSDSASLSPTQRTAISNAILRLDPLQKHGNHAPSGDLRQLWQRVDRALSSLKVEGPSEAYPLTATIDALSRRDDRFPDTSVEEIFRGQLGDVRTPGAGVAPHPVISAVISLIEMNRYSSTGFGRIIYH